MNEQGVPVKKSRVEVINDYLRQYPIEQHPDWYKNNLPDVYAGYMHASTKSTEQTKINMRVVAIVLGILAVFAVIVILILFGFLGQANEFLNF